MVDHLGLMAQVLSGNLRGDSITLNPNSSDSRTICGILSYETIESAGAEVRAPVMRIAACDREYVPHGTKVRLTSKIHQLHSAPFQVQGVQYADAATVNLYLLACD